MTKVFHISLKGVGPAGSLTTSTRRAKEKLAKRATKHSELRATLTSQKDENCFFLGKITMIERTCEDPKTLEEIVTEIDLADWHLINKRVAL